MFLIIKEILDRYVKEGNYYRIEGAKLSKDRKFLEIEVFLNFALSEKEIEEIKEEIKAKTKVKNVFLILIEEKKEEKLAKPEKPQFESKSKNKSTQYNSKNKKQKIFSDIPPTKLTTPLVEINEAKQDVVVEGFVFKKIPFTIKVGTVLVTLYLSDGETSIICKAFVNEKTWQEIDEKLAPNDTMKILGNVEWDLYQKSFVLKIKKIMLTEITGRRDEAENKRVELHAHTKMSTLDGVSDVAELIETADKWGHKAIAITDHGVVQAFPNAYAKAKKKNIKVIYGLEGYLFDDENKRLEDGTIDIKNGGVNHIIILAQNQEGLKNIYKLVSFSHIDYFYNKPRIPKSVLEQNREGLVLGTACEAGELYQAILNKKTKEEIKKIAEFYDYLEIQPLANNNFMIEKKIVSSKEDLIEINKEIVSIGEELSKPVVATCDTHYINKEDGKYREIIMVGMDYKDVETSGDLYFRTTEEMLEEFAYLGEEKAYEVVVTNPNTIANWMEEVKPLKDEKFPPKIEGADEELRETCIERAKKIYGESIPREIEERLEKELNSIISNGYAVMYVSAKKLVEKSLEDGYLVGSRGSVGSSFAATMAGITEVNPLKPHYICDQCEFLEWGDESKYDCGIDMPEKGCPKCGSQLNKEGFSIPFETFLGFEGDKEPDIDLNFAGEYQSEAHKYVDEIFGAENVFKAGTISTVAKKTAYGFTKKYFEKKEMPHNEAEIERLVEGCIGIRRTTGQHPGGIIILPRDKEIYEFCPVNYPANKSEENIVTTHFDYHSIDSNLLKLDMLGHDVPSMIKWLEDMTGINAKEIPLFDEGVGKLFLGVDSLNIQIENYNFTRGSYGIPEFGTKFVRKMLEETNPRTFGDLVKISGLSHGEDVWTNNAQEFIRSGDATIETIISTRDDIMNYLILKGLPKKLAFDIMENVRKGKGLKDDEVEVMKEKNVPNWYIESCKKIKYMFPRAHAVAYVMMACRIAYFKVYYPEAFYAAHLTTKLADFNWEVIKGGIEEVEGRIKLINSKGKEITKKEEDELPVMEICYEMLARGCEFFPPSLEFSEAKKFIVKENKVLVPLCALEGIGENVGEAIYNANKENPIRTIEELKERTKITKVGIAAMKENGLLDEMPESDQMSFL